MLLSQVHLRDDGPLLLVSRSALPLHELLVQLVAERAQVLLLLNLTRLVLNLLDAVEVLGGPISERNLVLSLLLLPAVVRRFVELKLWLLDIAIVTLRVALLLQLRVGGVARLAGHRTDHPAFDQGKLDPLLAVGATVARLGGLNKRSRTQGVLLAGQVLLELLAVGRELLAREVCMRIHVGTLISVLGRGLLLLHIYFEALVHLHGLVLVSEVVEHVELLEVALLSHSVFLNFDLGHLHRGPLHLDSLALLKGLEVEGVRGLVQGLRLAPLGVCKFL